MKNVNNNLYFRLLSGITTTLFLLFFLSSCASSGKDDPLKNTKKLTTEGHLSLYNNGAFRVPNTHIALIPPAPGALELIKELTGIRAKESFFTAIKRASESVYIVSEGTKLSYSVAKNTSTETIKLSDNIKAFSRENSIQIVYRSSELGKNIIGESFKLSKNLFNSKDKTGKSIFEATENIGNEIDEGGAKIGEGLIEKSLDTSKDISASSISRSEKSLSFAKKSFILGYAAVPANLKKRAVAIGDSLEDANIIKIVNDEDFLREDLSKPSVNLFSKTRNNYKEDVANSFKKAKDELKYQTSGLSLSALKSLRWVLQGIFWDATIEPAAKMSAASLGYIGVNFVAFPALIIFEEGVATTKLAVEISWDAAKTGYDIVAPSSVAAVASIYTFIDFTGSNLLSGTTAVSVPVAGYAEKGISKVASVTVKGAGFAAGKGVQYIGIPIASAGILVGGGAIGTAVGSVGVATGGALGVTGETGSVTTNIFGNVIAGTTLVGGSAASAGAGASYGIYQLSKAVAVPASYELGSGIVLSYETMSHIAAHSILAVSDASYMVLSLEGPRWVLYAVKGKKGDGADLPVGAVVNLNELNKSGEEIMYLPVSDKEMKEVVDSVYGNLPEIKNEEESY